MANHEKIKHISVNETYEMLKGVQEVAFLDVRDEGIFNEGHAFYAISAPLNTLELRIKKIVPRKDVCIVLMDCGAMALAELAAKRLLSWGYQNVNVMEGGASGWQQAGHVIFGGVHVPSKAFGEYVELEYKTPAIDANTLQNWIDTDKDMIILDSRPYEEFHKFSIPNGINCPGAELVHRAFGLVQNEATTIVINCAGRTRGIIGAQSLINAGIKNPVVTLENGTQGWVLSGKTMQVGNTKIAPPPSVVGLQQAETAANAVAQKYNIREIDNSELNEFEKDKDRTLFLLDVRTPEEYRAGHLPGFLSAPGGQLIQSIDYYVGVKNSRIVLCDDNGIRAKMTASWLIQMGYADTFVMKGGISNYQSYLCYGEEPELNYLPDSDSGSKSITVLELKALINKNKVTILDLSTSIEYKKGHIPDAWFIVRSRLKEDLAKITLHETVVLTSPDGRFAHLVTEELEKLTTSKVYYLRGGTKAWVASGLELATDNKRMASMQNDVWYSPYDEDDIKSAMQRYLKWETGLIEQLKLDDSMPAWVISTKA